MCYIMVVRNVLFISLKSHLTRAPERDRLLKARYQIMSDCRSGVDALCEHTLELSKYLQSLVIAGYDSSDICDDEMAQIKTLSTKILNDLEDENKAPNYRITSGDRIFQAMNILAFGLLVQNDKKDKESELEKLRHKFNDLQDRYDALVAQELRGVDENQRVLTMLSNKFNLENVTSFDEFADLMAAKESEMEVQIKALEAELVKRSRKNEQLKKIAVVAEEVRKENEALEMVLHDQNRGDDDSKLYILQAEFEELKSKYESLQAEMKEVKLNERKMKEQKMETEKMLSMEMQAKQSLSIELQRITIELEDLKNLEALREGESDVEKHLAQRTEQMRALNNLNESLADQVEQLVSELSDLSAQRNLCLSVIEKQGTLLDCYENQLERTDSSEKLELPSPSQENVLTKVETERDCSNIVLDVIKRHTQSLLSDEAVRTLESDRKDLDEKIEAVVRDLVSSHQTTLAPSTDSQTHELEKENKMLTERLSDLVKFMQKLTNSEELMGEILDDSFETQRDILVAQCKRVEDFLLRADVDVESVPSLLKCANWYATDDPEQLRTLLEHSCFVNDMMRAYCQAVQEHAEMLTMQLNEMKTESVHLDDHVNEATFELHNELAEVKRERDEAMGALAEFQDRLMKECDEVHPVREDVLLDISSRFSQMPNGYLRRIAELEEALEDYDALCKEHRCLVSQGKKLQRQLTKLQNIFTVQEEEKQKLQGANAELEEQLNSSMRRIEKLHGDNSLLRENLEELTTTVSEMEEKKNHEIELVRAEQQQIYDADVEELNKQIEELKEMIEMAENERAEAEKNLKKQHQKEKESLHRALSEQSRSAEELRVNMESLVVDLRNKLQTEREQLASSRKKLSDQEELYQELKEELSSTRISQKMTESKLTALEERTRREKALLEGQTKIKVLNLENQYETDIEALKLEMKQNVRNILVRVCEVFKRFYDFREQITEESVVRLLEKVTSLMSDLEAKNDEYKASHENLDRVCQILGARNVQDALSQLPVLLSARTQFEQLEQEVKECLGTAKDRKTAEATISRLEQELNVWTLWAKRLHAMATEEFSVRKSPQSLRFVIEEALMSAIGQRQVWRRMEILRTEKQILTENDREVLARTDSDSPISLRSQVAAFVAIYRLQKLSGHVHCFVTHPLPPGVERVKRKQQTPAVPIPGKHRYPIFDAM